MTVRFAYQQLHRELATFTICAILEATITEIRSFLELQRHKVFTFALLEGAGLMKASKSKSHLRRVKLPRPQQPFRSFQLNSHEVGSGWRWRKEQGRRRGEGWGVVGVRAALHAWMVAPPPVQNPKQRLCSEFSQFRTLTRLFD